MVSVVSRAAAQADINNGTIRLGVTSNGALIVTPTVVPLNSAVGTGLVGVRYMPTNNDGSAQGVALDGWSVADSITNQWGGATVDAGMTNLSAVSQTSTASTAICNATAAGIFQVTHDFHPSTNPNAYEITVTVRNISAATVNARYRRMIDWDIEPQATSEFVTIQGATLSGILNFTNDALFSPLNPLLPPVGTPGDIVNSGPGDLGATITFNLGMMAPGASVTFNHYYGAAADRASALSVVTALGLQGYTLASPAPPGGSPANVGTPNTFLYGFFGTFIGGGPPPPLPAGPEGTFAGSSSGPPPGSFEGGFGFGGRYRSVATLYGPFSTQAGGTRTLVLPPSESGNLSGSGPLTVYNISHREGNTPMIAAADGAQPIVPLWSLGVTAFAGLALAAAAFRAARAGG
jgi:hypothetical protein